MLCGKDFKIAKAIGVQSTIVIGDSNNIVNHMVHISDPRDQPLASILNHIK
jgi:hypothetical protein